MSQRTDPRDDFDELAESGMLPSTPNIFSFFINELNKTKCNIPSDPVEREKKAKEEFENDCPQITTQLRSIGREIVYGKSDGDCLLRAITIQLNDPTVDHCYLRSLTCHHVLHNAKHYSKFLALSEADVKNLALQCQRPGEYSCVLSIIDQVIDIIGEVIGKRIVVLHEMDDCIYPSECYSDETIVLVESFNHYMAAVPLK